MEKYGIMDEYKCDCGEKIVVPHNSIVKKPGKKETTEEIPTKNAEHQHIFEKIEEV